ncbi:unnamed protein product, partial [Sphagnum balticum]
QVKSTTECKENETLKIHFESELQIGNGKLTIEFSGIIGDNVRGFYKTKCLNRNGPGYAAVTQFEAAYARQAFPCFDEPSLKATFDIVIIADKTKTVLSNMPLKTQSTVDANKDKFVFERTPIMSTYLVAYVVGEFDYIEGSVKEANDVHSTAVRVYTPVGKSAMGQFALEITLKVLTFYRKYFDLSYPLPKLDLIAIYDLEIESLVLIDPSNYSVQSKIKVALIVSHELAHQWFGNLVTMEWWTDLWLNEGFATWVEYLSVEHCVPEWGSWGYFIYDHLSRALDLDSLNSSHPIEVNVTRLAEINQIFDEISYCKGASVIRMVNNFVGKDTFARGLQIYLKRFLYKNASTSDLWTEIGNAAGLDVKELMQCWTKMKGYPLIEMKNSQGHTILELTQHKFQTLSDKKADDVQLWNIPITACTRSSFPKVHAHTLMNSPSSELDMGIIENTSDWILLNCDFINYHRTKYSDEMFEEIVANLNTSFGSSLDRMGLLSDTFAL